MLGTSRSAEAPPAKASPVLAMIDRMMNAPVAERAVATAPNPHAGAASTVGVEAAKPVLGQKALQVERPTVVPDSLDEAAELFKTIFKGDLIP